MLTILRLLLVRWVFVLPKWILKSVPRASIFFFTLGYLLGSGYIKSAELVKWIVAEVQNLL